MSSWPNLLCFHKNKAQTITVYNDVPFGPPKLHNGNTGSKSDVSNKILSREVSQIQ